MNYKSCGIKECEYYGTGTCIVGIPHGRGKCRAEKNKKVHKLKSLPKYFEAVKDGRKQFEIRKNDRDFKVNDSLLLKEWTPKKGYTGRELLCDVVYILDEQPYVPKGYVCMSIY